MFCQIDREAANQPDGEHFGLERSAQRWVNGHLLAVGDAELAVAVDGRCPHQVADGVDQCAVRLLAASERVDDVIEQAHAFVGAAEGQITHRVACRFLSGGSK